MENGALGRRFCLCHITLAVLSFGYGIAPDIASQFHLGFVDREGDWRSCIDLQFIVADILDIDYQHGA